MLRDLKSRLIFVFYKEFEVADVLVAKGLALLEGLQICVIRQTQGIQVEVDSMLKSRKTEGLRYCQLLRNVGRLLKVVSISFIHIFREANTVADRLAALRGQATKVFESYQQLPREVRACLALDAWEFQSIRRVRDIEIR